MTLPPGSTERSLDRYHVTRHVISDSHVATLQSAFLPIPIAIPSSFIFLLTSSIFAH